MSCVLLHSGKISIRIQPLNLPKFKNEQYESSIAVSPEKFLVTLDTSPPSTRLCLGEQIAFEKPRISKPVPSSPSSYWMTWHCRLSWFTDLAWLSLEPWFRKKCLWWLPGCVCLRCHMSCDVMGWRCCLSLEPLGLVGVPETACAQKVCVFSSVWINLSKREAPTVPQKLRSTPFDVVRPHVKWPLQNLKHDREVKYMTHTSSFI